MPDAANVGDDDAGNGVEPKPEEPDCLLPFLCPDRGEDGDNGGPGNNGNGGGNGNGNGNGTLPGLPPPPDDDDD